MSIPEITTYAQAIAVQETNAIAAQLIADMDALGVEVAGFGDLSVQRALPQLQAAAENHLQKLRVILVKAGVPTTASEAGSDWVDVTLSGFFQETRFPAIAAQWLLQLTCASTAGPYTLAAGDAVAQDQTGTTFVNLDPIRVSAGGTAIALFEARTAGTVGNSAPGLIDHLVIGKPGLSITNSPPASLYIGGADAESDAAYLVRCMGKWGVISAGASFEERIKSAPIYDFLVPGAAPTVTRWLVRDDNPMGPGTIAVCLANAAGPATLAECNAVAKIVVPVKPVGSGKTYVFAAAPQYQAIAAVLQGDGSRAADALITDAIRVVETLETQYPIGSLAVRYLYRNKVIELLEEIPGVLNAVVTSPAADVPLAPYAVLILNPSFTAP